MTDEQKREQISFLYRQLDTCGQIIAETEPGPERSRYNREYRGIINALRRLEPEKWKDYPVFRQHTTEGRNEMVQKFLDAGKHQVGLAGINHGFNMGISTLYSGTMACVYEGIMHGVPSVAFSYGLHWRETVTTGCEPLVDQVLQRVLKGGLPKDVCLNVNIPPMTEHPVKGLKVTISDLGRWVNEWEKRDHPMGGNYYWMTGDYEMLDDNDDRTDMYWLRRHYATVTPCHIDQTDYQSLKAVSDLLL